MTDENDNTTAAAPAAEAAQPAPTEQSPTQTPDAGAPARRTRRPARTRPTPETGGDGPDSPDVSAPVEPQAPVRSPRSRTRKPAAARTPAPAQDQSAEPAVDPAAAQRAEPVPDAGAPGTDQAAARPRRSRRRAEPASEPAATAPAAEQAEAPSVPGEPGAQATSDRLAGGPPKLATTALLFQAPDPGARPRRRRAEAPAGPPRPAETPDEPEAEEPDQQPQEQTPDLAQELVELEQGSTEHGEDAGETASRRRRRRGGRGRRSRGGAEGAAGQDESEQGETDTEEVAPAEETGAAAEDEQGGEGTSSRRRRRRRRSGREADDGPAPEAQPRSRSRGRTASDEVTALKGSTRLEAKRQRRREGRDAGRRRTVITEAEFLARRESVERSMVVREANGRVQIAVLEDGVLVEHYVSRSAQNGQPPMAGNVYLGRVQNVLPSMEAAFVDVGKGRNAVLYAGEVNWDAAGLEGQPRRIEQALKSGDPVLVQVTKDPMGHKGARLTSQVTLAGRYLVYVPGGGMTGISRKLPDTERARLKRILKEVVPDEAGVIVRTAAEGASEEELRRDVARLQEQWTAIEKRAKTASPPALLQGEPDLAIRVVRDIFNDDFASLVVQGEDVWSMISEYVGAMAPDLADKTSRWTGSGDVFAAHRVDEQLAKGLDRKVWLPSGGSLVIDRTEAMTVIDVNTGKFTGSGGTLEETVTRNNLEAAEEIVRQLRLRDIGGIIVIDFIDMVLESNRDLVLRRLVECLGRDRTKHQVAEVTSLGLVQMTRKRVGQGLVEAFSETCPHCNGRGFIVHSEPVDPKPSAEDAGGPVTETAEPKRRRKKAATASATPSVPVPVLPEAREAVKATLATIAAAAAHAHEHKEEAPDDDGPALEETVTVADAEPETPPAADASTGSV